MKKTKWLLAIIALTAIMAFGFIACDDGGGGGTPTGTDSLAGTSWINEYIFEGIAAKSLRIDITSATEWKQIYISNGMEVANGTYTLSETALTITIKNQYNGTTLAPVNSVKKATLEADGKSFVMDYDNNGIKVPFKKTVLFTLNNITVEMQNEAGTTGYFIFGLFPTSATRTEVLADVDGIKEYKSGYPYKVVAFEGANVDDISWTGTPGTTAIGVSTTLKAKNSYPNWYGTGTFDGWVCFHNGTEWTTYKTNTPIIITNAASGTNQTRNAVSDFTKIGQTIDYTVAATGDPDTTAITLTFDSAVTGLEATDITITAGTGSATRGALTGSGINWSLEVSNVLTGTVKVKINKTGIESAEKEVAIIGSSGPLNPDWSVKYSSSSSFVEIRNNGTLIDFTGHTDGGLTSFFGDSGSKTAAITITAGGDVKAGGTVIGKYAYVNKGSTKIGILASGVNAGSPIYMLGLGAKDNSGVNSVIKNFTDGGATFDPQPVITGINTEISWSGRYPYP